MIYCAVRDLVSELQGSGIWVRSVCMGSSLHQSPF